ncbi:Adenylosuccinate lyase [Spatholobus suberectus]|nr:Adenylosuccinate lyase [Spatholobus suberectus]
MILKSMKSGEIGVSCRKEWRKRQIRKITDQVFDKVKNQVQTDHLSFVDLYIAVLLVYNGINKYVTGPHFDPPSKDRVREVIKNCDVDMDGQINRDEFFGFIQQMAPETFHVVRKKLVATLVVAPTVAVSTKKATEGVLGVGKLVQRLPKPVYAVLMTIAAVWFQENGSRLGEDCLLVIHRYGVPEHYEKLKELTRGRAVTKESIRDFIEGLDIPKEAKMDLLKLTPDTYIGAAVELARTVENAVNIANGMKILETTD